MRKGAIDALKEKEKKLIIILNIKIVYYFTESMYQSYGAGSIPAFLNAANNSSSPSILMELPTTSPTPGRSKSTYQTKN